MAQKCSSATDRAAPGTRRSSPVMDRPSRIVRPAWQFMLLAGRRLDKSGTARPLSAPMVLAPATRAVWLFGNRIKRNYHRSLYLEVRAAPNAHRLVRTDRAVPDSKL